VLLNPYNCIVILKIRMLSALISIYAIILHSNPEFKKANTFFNLKDLILK